MQTIRCKNFEPPARQSGSAWSSCSGFETKYAQLNCGRSALHTHMQLDIKWIEIFEARGGKNLPYPSHSKPAQRLTAGGCPPEYKSESRRHSVRATGTHRPDLAPPIRTQPFMLLGGLDPIGSD
jgi:hypothetical protein